MSKIDWHTHPWQRLTLLSDKAVLLSTTKVFVFSDSVLSLGKMHQYPASIGTWIGKIEWLMTTPQYRELNQIDGEPTEFEWTICPGHTTMQILEEIQKMMDEMQCEPEPFTGLIIFMSMYNDTVRRSKDFEEMCIANSLTVAEYAKLFSPGHWSFLGPGSENKWYGSEWRVGSCR